jgi:hypothetical protein
MQYPNAFTATSVCPQQMHTPSLQLTVFGSSFNSLNTSKVNDVI